MRTHATSRVVRVNTSGLRCIPSASHCSPVAHTAPAGAEELDQQDPGDEPSDVGKIRDSSLSDGRDAPNAPDQLDREPDTDQHHGREAPLPDPKRDQNGDQDPVARELDQERAEHAAIAPLAPRFGTVEAGLTAICKVLAASPQTR